MTLERSEIHNKESRSCTCGHAVTIIVYKSDNNRSLSRAPARNGHRREGRRGGDEQRRARDFEQRRRRAAVSGARRTQVSSATAAVICRRAGATARRARCRRREVTGWRPRARALVIALRRRRRQVAARCRHCSHFFACRERRLSCRYRDQYSIVDCVDSCVFPLLKASRLIELSSSSIDTLVDESRRLRDDQR